MLKLVFANRVATQCGTCRFWQADEGDDDVLLGECRIHAPEFSPSKPIRADVVAPAAFYRQPAPLTESGNWCVEWKS